MELYKSDWLWNYQKKKKKETELVLRALMPFLVSSPGETRREEDVSVTGLSWISIMVVPPSFTPQTSV